jgi:hypothetical protein
MTSLRAVPSAEGAGSERNRQRLGGTSSWARTGSRPAAWEAANLTTIVEPYLLEVDWAPA